MITKERLQELIEQEETIWCVSELWGSNKLKLHNKDVRDSDCFYISKTLLLSDSVEFYDEEETYRVPFQLLFETQQEYLKHQEEAEWHKEFGCIERTERLELPTWEEFNEMSSFIFENKDGINLEMAIWCCYREGLQIKTIKITNFNDWNIRLFEQPLTKENYTLACRKAKELFLGEKK